MRLIELSSNKKSFHTVTFNKKGLSIITASKEHDDSDDKRKTYNSVGKSLIIRLIHFCLASNPIEEFNKKLPDWEFTLEFEHNDVKYVATRSTSNQKIIILNEEEISLTKFRDKFEEEVFGISKSVKFLKFRPLISRFIRPKKSSYVEYDNFVDEEQDYSRMLNNAFLLGLNVNNISTKYELKKDYDKVMELRKNIKKDPILQNFFEEDDDINLMDLEDKCKGLADKIKKYEIAENYYEIKKEADELSSQLRMERNKSTRIRNAIKNINRSLSIKLDISKEKLLKLYEEARVVFNGSIKKQIQEIELFNQKLIKNREQRLKHEKEKLKSKLIEVEETIEKLSIKEDKQLQYLDTHGALDEYATLNNQLSDYRAKLRKFKLHKDLMDKYDNKVEQINIDFHNENIKTNKYLYEAKSIIHDNINLFKRYAQKFYKDKKAGITVLNNTGENLMRYDINAKIVDDTGDAVNEVKIFCYDWAMLVAQHNHSVNFVFHDSRLLSDMDPRQITTLFEIVHSEARKNGYQYIISINENFMDVLASELSSKKYEEIIEKNIILELTDESDGTKLLGIHLDLEYEKD